MIKYLTDKIGLLERKNGKGFWEYSRTSLIKVSPFEDPFKEEECFYVAVPIYMDQDQVLTDVIDTCLPGVIEESYARLVNQGYRPVNNPKGIKVLRVPFPREDSVEDLVETLTIEDN